MIITECSVGKGVKVLQDESAFKFGIDALLLANFTKAKRTDTVIDLGTGNGIIPLLLYANKKGHIFKALEIQDSAVELAEESVRLSGASNAISVIKGDIKDCKSIFGANYADVVVSNPPYYDCLSGCGNICRELEIARHEVLCSLDDVISSALSVLKGNGAFYMIHRAERLQEIFCICSKYRSAVKRMQLVYPSADKEANLVLVEIRPFAKNGIRIESPLIVYQKDQNSKNIYTIDVEQIRQSMLQ